MPFILTFRRERQVDLLKFETSLDYIVTFRSFMATHEDSVLTTTTTTKKQTFTVEKSS